MLYCVQLKLHQTLWQSVHSGCTFYCVWSQRKNNLVPKSPPKYMPFRHQNINNFLRRSTAASPVSFPVRRGQPLPTPFTSLGAITRLGLQRSTQPQPQHNSMIRPYVSANSFTPTVSNCNFQTLHVMTSLHWIMHGVWLRCGEAQNKKPYIYLNMQQQQMFHT